jgi:hypothetical protein
MEKRLNLIPVPTYKIQDQKEKDRANQAPIHPAVQKIHRKSKQGKSAQGKKNKTKGKIIKETAKGPIWEKRFLTFFPFHTLRRRKEKKQV